MYCQISTILVLLRESTTATLFSTARARPAPLRTYNECRTTQLELFCVALRCRVAPRSTSVDISNDLERRLTTVNHSIFYLLRRLSHLWQKAQLSQRDRAIRHIYSVRKCLWPSELEVVYGLSNGIISVTLSYLEGHVCWLMPFELLCLRDYSVY